MGKEITKYFESLKALRNEIENDFDLLSTEQLNFKPTENSWSLLQVMEHLALAETGSINYLNKKILGIDSLEKAGFGSSFRFLLLKMFFGVPLKYGNRAPSAEPTENPDYEDLKLKWDIARSGLLEFYNSHYASIKNKLIYKHPKAGRITFEQMCNFFELHIKHHQKQITRIKGNENFPKK